MSGARIADWRRHERKLNLAECREQTWSTATGCRMPVVAGSLQPTTSKLLNLRNHNPGACRRCSVLAGYSGRGEASVPPSTSRPSRTPRIINSVDGGASVPNLRTARFCLRSRESWRFCCSYASGRQFSPAIYVVIGSRNVPRQAAGLSTDPFHCGFARAACQFRRPCI